MLSCEANEEELSWVWPTPPGPVSGYIPRTKHCVAEAISTTWPDSAASALLRRTRSLRDVSHKVLVAVLRPATVDKAVIESLESALFLRDRAGGLGGPHQCPDVLASHGTPKEADSVIRMYATSADFAANRSMAARFARK